MLAETKAWVCPWSGETSRAELPRRDPGPCTPAPSLGERGVADYGGTVCDRGRWRPPLRGRGVRRRWGSVDPIQFYGVKVVVGDDGTNANALNRRHRPPRRAGGRLLGTERVSWEPAAISFTRCLVRPSSETTIHRQKRRRNETKRRRSANFTAGAGTDFSREAPNARSRHGFSGRRRFHPPRIPCLAPISSPTGTEWVGLTFATVCCKPKSVVVLPHDADRTRSRAKSALPTARGPHFVGPRGARPPILSFVGPTDASTPSTDPPHRCVPHI